ncbi:hypothetical protein C0033_02400 [Clostridium sp. chh4-2]|nr:hypothetical protein C0033_02400 [Clostridium sp. chh4-2]
MAAELGDKMSIGTILVLTLAAIIICILLNYKLNINLGIPAIIFAWLIGCFCLNMKVKAVVSQWPTSIVFQLMCITMFFAFATQNGTMKKVADSFIYRFRKQTWMIPLVIYFAGFSIGGMGAPGATANIIMSVIGFNIAAEVGLHPLIIAAVACHGGAAGSELPWSAQGIIAKGVIQEYWPEHADSYTWKLWLAYLILSLVICIGVSLIFGGFKKRAALEYAKPESFTKEQKYTLIIIGSVVGLSLLFPIINTLCPGITIVKLLAGYMDIQMLCMVGILLCILLKLGNQKEAIAKGVPWSTIVMLGGMAMLMNIAGEAGATDYIAALLSKNMSPAVIVAILGVLAGFLSFFSGGMSVVFPMLASLVPPIAEATGIPAYAMLAAICCGARITALSPFSTGGALIMGANPVEKNAKLLFNGQLVISLVSLALVGAGGLIGIFTLL